MSEWASEQKGMNEQTKEPERALPQHGTEVQLSKSDGSRACANTAGVSLVAGVYISLPFDIYAHGRCRGCVGSYV